MQKPCPTSPLFHENRQNATFSRLKVGFLTTFRLKVDFQAPHTIFRRLFSQKSTFLEKNEKKEKKENKSQ